jgi:hypothetical protein
MLASSDTALGMFEWLKYLASGLSFATAVTLFFRWRDYERKKAAGSTLTVTDGVDRRNVRWAKLNLRSWTASPIRIGRLRVLWPLGLGGYAYTDEDSVKAIMIYDRSIELPEGCRSIVITPPAEIPESNSLRLTFFVKADQSLRQSRRRSRLYAWVSGETVDAQRRRVGLLLRSGPVDWSKPPQK